MVVCWGAARLVAGEALVGERLVVAAGLVPGERLVPGVRLVAGDRELPLDALPLDALPLDALPLDALPLVLDERPLVPERFRACSGAGALAGAGMAAGS